MLRMFRGGLVLLAVVGSMATPAAAQAPVDPSAPVFDDTTLRELRLAINSRDWEALKAHYRENTYYPCTLTLGDHTIRNIGIRSRGFGSRSETKPGLRVDVNHYLAGQTFFGLEAFVLDNLLQDQSMLRERLSMSVFARLGLPAPREAHVKLFVNNELVGVYGLVEEINKEFLKRVFGGVEGAIENDGYLFEYKWSGPYYFNYLGDALEPYQRLLEARTHENAALSDLYGRIHDLVRNVNEATEDDYERIVSRHFELNTLMTHLAVENFMADFDGMLGDFGMANFYLYQFEDSQRWQFLPWDKDNTFAPPTGEEPRRAIEYDIFRHFDVNQLVRRGIGVPAVRELYLDALLRIGDVVMETLPLDEFPHDRRGWLEREIARQYDQIRDAAHADPTKPYTTEDFEHSVQYLLQFARERALFVRESVRRARAQH